MGGRFDLRIRQTGAARRVAPAPHLTAWLGGRALLDAARDGGSPMLMRCVMRRARRYILGVQDHQTPHIGALLA